MKIPLILAQQVGEELTKRELSKSELILSILVLVFTILLVAIISFITVRKNQGFGSVTTKMYIITIVVGGSLFLLTAGYSNEQMTPIIGLLGTIVGYALGKSNETSN